MEQHAERMSDASLHQTVAASRHSSGELNGISSIKIRGAFDFCDSSLEGALRNMLLLQPSQLIVDLSESTYMTSMGVACLLKALKMTRSTGILVYGATPDMLKLLQLAGLDRYVKVYANGSSAKSAVVRAHVLKTVASANERARHAA